MSRVGEPDDIAGVVDFLTSDAARWITGASVPAGWGSVLSYAPFVRISRPNAAAGSPLQRVVCRRG
ncbi:hypothetical protein ACW9HJ_13170 [Nocardia gipuzkoensis]